MRIDRQCLWILALGAACLACVSGGGSLSPPPGPATPISSGEGDLPPSQRLFRVHYRGPSGGGSLKLTLRAASDQRFQLAAADPLGRAVWGLELFTDGVLFLDHREGLFCDLPIEVRLPELALAPLPVRSLSRVLTGRLPIRPDERQAKATGDRLDFEDAEGRRWSAVFEEDGAKSWTLWADGRPLLWWSRQPGGGGILSHREGAQFRWRQTVAEPLSGDLKELEVPPAYRRGACDAEVRR